MEEDGEGERRAQEQELHHDRLNEFGEETWSALGENLESLNALINRSSSGNLQIWRELEADMQIAVGSMTPPELPTAAPSVVPFISEESIETYENREFMAEEVDTLQSCCSKDEAMPEVQKPPLTNRGLEVLKTSATRVYESSISSRASLGRSGLGEFCRICHAANYHENYISPCNCRGSLSLVHQSCLERWLAQSDSNTCELCGHTFRMARIPKFGMIMSVAAWLRSSSRDRRRLLLDTIMFIFFCPIVSLCNVLGVKAVQSLEALLQSQILHALSDPLTQGPSALKSLLYKSSQIGIFSMVLTVDFSFAVWLMSKSQQHVSRWYSWYRRNSLVKLIGYSEVDVSIKGEPSTASANNIRSISF